MEMFRTPTSQPSGLSSVKIVASDETASTDAYYTEVTVLSGATWTISSGVTVYAGSYVNEGVIENNGTLVVDSSYDEDLEVDDGCEVFKSSNPRTFMEVYPE